MNPADQTFDEFCHGESRGVVLEKSKQERSNSTPQARTGEVLGVEGKQGQSFLRDDEQEDKRNEVQMESPQDVICPSEQGDLSRTSNLSPLRQSSLCQPDVPIPRNGETEHSRCPKEGTAKTGEEGSIRNRDNVQTGSSIEPRNAIQDKGPEGLPELLPNQGRETQTKERVEAENGERLLHQGSSIQQPERLPATQDEKKILQSVHENSVKKQTIQANERGVITGSTFDECFRIARVYHASGLMPKGLNTVEKVYVAIQLLNELSLPVASSIGKVMVVNQVASIFGELPLALVFKSGKCVAHEDVFEIKDGKPYASTCTTQRQGMKPVTRRFTIDDAKAAGLFKNDVWTKFPQRMLECRARAWALKSAFPDVLSGINILEYDHNTIPNERGEIEVQSESASKLNALVAKTNGETNVTR
jgi:hypothetical protein